MWEGAGWFQAVAQKMGEGKEAGRVLLWRQGLLGPTFSLWYPGAFGQGLLNVYSF